MKTTLLINFASRYGINQLRRSLTDERIDISISISSQLPVRAIV